MRLWATHRTEEAVSVAVVALCLHVLDGVTPEAALAINKELDALGPNGWWFLNPGTFLVVNVDTPEGRGCAEQCRSVFDRLKHSHGCLLDAGLGESEGMVTALLDAKHRFLKIPVGAPMSLCMARAHEAAR